MAGPCPQDSAVPGSRSPLLLYVRQNLAREGSWQGSQHASPRVDSARKQRACSGPPSCGSAARTGSRPRRPRSTPCPRTRWTVFHDVRWPGRKYANIDHVAVGPSGIFVIDSKNWSGMITIRDNVLRQSGRAREEAVVGAAEAALAVARVTPGGDTPTCPARAVLRSRRAADRLGSGRHGVLDDEPRPAAHDSPRDPSTAHRARGLPAARRHGPQRHGTRAHPLHPRHPRHPRATATPRPTVPQTAPRQLTTASPLGRRPAGAGRSDGGRTPAQAW